MSKREFWKRISYVKCPEPDCKYRTKVRMSLIAHLIRIHGYLHNMARDKADETGIYCPATYRRISGESQK